jgi:uncharacterized protein (DUF58 family)
MNNQRIIEEVAREILIKTKRKIFSHNIGNNPTTFVGNGLDFSELREYYFGDDVRKINWNATAKEQRPYINLFTEERELNIVIAFMAGGSIAFGSQRIKQELMAEIVALLGFSAMKNNDMVTTLAFDTKEVYFRKPTKSINALHEIIPSLLKLDTLGEAVDYANFSEYLLGRIKQKSIIFIVGDFFESLDLSLLSAKHELYAVMVRDPFEEHPKFDTALDLIDPNSLEHHSFEFDAGMLRAYQEEIQQRDRQHYEHFLGHKIGYSKIYTNEDPFFKLNNLVR